MSEMKKSNALLSDEIVSPLTLFLRSDNRKIAQNIPELLQAIALAGKLKLKHGDDPEAISVIDEQLKWLHEGLEIYEDPEERMPAALITLEFYGTGSTPYGDILIPANDDELNYWHELLGYMEKHEAKDEQFEEDFSVMKELVDACSGDSVYEAILEQIFDNEYSLEVEGELKYPANKEELFSAMAMALDESDFESISSDTVQGIRDQKQGFKVLMDSLQATEEEYLAFYPKYKERIEALKKSALAGEPVEHEEEGTGFEYDPSSPNVKAYALIDKMFYALTYVDKDGNRYATSLEEADEAEALVDKAEAAIKDQNDSEIHNLIATNRNHVKEARSRKFAGAWWLIACSLAVTIFYFYSSFGRFDPRMTLDKAQIAQQRDIGYVQDDITRYEKKEAELGDLSRADGNYLEDKKERMEELREMTPDEYASERYTAATMSGLKGILKSLYELMWIVFYFLAARPFGYMRFKRQREYQRISGATGWAAKIGAAILGFFWAIPVTTTITKWSDGTTTRDNDALPLLAIKLGITFLVIMTVIWAAYIILPFAAVIAYIRNYPDQPGAKQVNYALKGVKNYFQGLYNKLFKK